MITETEILKAGYTLLYEWDLLTDVYAKGDFRLMYDASEEVIVWLEVKNEKQNIGNGTT